MAYCNHYCTIVHHFINSLLGRFIIVCKPPTTIDNFHSQFGKLNELLQIIYVSIIGGINTTIVTYPRNGIPIVSLAGRRFSNRKSVAFCHKRLPYNLTFSFKFLIVCFDGTIRNSNNYIARTRCVIPSFRNLHYVKIIQINLRSQIIAYGTCQSVIIGFKNFFVLFGYQFAKLKKMGNILQ